MMTGIVRTGRLLIPLILSVATTPSTVLCALPEVLPPETMSMGQPTRVPFSWGPSAGYDFKRDEITGRLFAQVARRRFLGPLDLAVEGAAGFSGTSLDAGIGAYAGPPWLLAGIEYNARDENLTFGLVLQFAGKRGGLFRRGDRLRVDYRPPAHEVSLGFMLTSPFHEYRMTRPRERFITVPSGEVSTAAPLDPALEARVTDIVHAVEWMDRLLTPRFASGDGFTKSAEGYLAHIQAPGHTYDEEDSTYHHSLEAAFAMVLGGDLALAREIAGQAEATIYNEVLVPFNRTFGQDKKPNHAGGFCRAAADEFAGYLERHAALQSLGAQGSLRAAVLRSIYRRVLKAIEDVSHRARDRWQDSFLFFNARSSLAWLPLNYGLQHHQYDTQDEWNAVLADLTEQKFADCNHVEYLMAEQFHLRTKTMIREARDHQVTIVHDFRGKTPEGDVDIYGWDMVVDGYIEAFVRAVSELNEGTRRRLPQFFLFLDDNYYQANDSRAIMTYLENLYDPRTPQLKEKTVQDQIEIAHATLRAAIASSPVLSQLSDEELRRAFKVHVNITNPFDLAISLDVSRRDHRKIAYRDILEDDPAAGIAIFTGQGIGEHYNGSAWEDRSLIVRGPALVQLKDETRRLFMGQGYRADEVPDCLQPKPAPPDIEERCRQLEENGWTTPVSISMNETGYGYKKASVLKTAIYNLAPDSSYLMTFDSLWLSDFWASMFISAALRGVHVLPVAPSPRNAPSNAAFTLYYLRENMELMLRAQTFFKKEIERNNGLLRVGIYAHAVPIDDIGRRMVTFIRGRDAYPFLKEEFPFHPDVQQLLDEHVRTYRPTSVVKLRLHYRPLLHLKMQLFGTREALKVFGLPQWGPILGSHLRIRERQLKGEDNPGVTPSLLKAKSPYDRTLQEALEGGFDGTPTHRDGVIFTLTTGSQNQDPRAMLLDGEALVAISGFNSLITGIDCMFVLGIASWPTTLEEFEQLYPKIKVSFPLNVLLGLIKYQL